VKRFRCFIPVLFQFNFSCAVAIGVLAAVDRLPFASGPTGMPGKARPHTEADQLDRVSWRSEFAAEGSDVTGYNGTHLVSAVKTHVTRRLQHHRPNTLRSRSCRFTKLFVITFIICLNQAARHTLKIKRTQLTISWQY